MSHYWNDDERDTTGMVSSMVPHVEVKERYVSVCDVLKELYNDQKEKQYMKIRQEPRRANVFAKPPPTPVVQSVEARDEEELEHENEQEQEAETNDPMLEAVYKKYWYS
jgi:hypothetical protein